MGATAKTKFWLFRIRVVTRPTEELRDTRTMSGEDQIETRTGAPDRKGSELARKAVARLPTTLTRKGTESSAERVDVFPPTDSMRDGAVAQLLEADDPTPDMQVGAVSVDRDGLLLAGLVACDEIARQTNANSAARAERMDNVIRLRFAQMAERVDGEFNPLEVLRSMATSWDEAARTIVLIELSSVDPFSPFDLKHSRQAFRAGLERIAELVGATEAELAGVQETLSDAKKSHRGASLSSVGLWGVGGAVLIGAVGFAAAPVLGAALGSAAGLSGAAATSFGLSTLGGGSLAAGGLGMSGGLWMVTGTAAATGMVGSGGGALLYSLGGRQFRGEIVKLQATYKLVVLRSQADQAIAQAVVTDLHTDAELLRGQVVEERKLNDANSNRIKELETKIEAIEEALDWMDSLEAEPS